jgi:hypothetical protein
MWFYPQKPFCDYGRRNILFFGKVNPHSSSGMLLNKLYRNNENLFNSVFYNKFLYLLQPVNWCMKVSALQETISELFLLMFKFMFQIWKYVTLYIFSIIYCRGASCSCRVVHTLSSSYKVWTLPIDLVLHIGLKTTTCRKWIPFTASGRQNMKKLIFCSAPRYR